MNAATDLDWLYVCMDYISTASPLCWHVAHSFVCCVTPLFSSQVLLLYSCCIAPATSSPHALRRERREEYVLCTPFVYIGLAVLCCHGDAGHMAQAGTGWVVLQEAVFFFFSPFFSLLSLFWKSGGTHQDVMWLRQRLTDRQMDRRVDGG